MCHPHLWDTEDLTWIICPVYSVLSIRHLYLTTWSTTNSRSICHMFSNYLLYHSSAGVSLETLNTQNQLMSHQRYTIQETSHLHYTLHMSKWQVRISHHLFTLSSISTFVHVLSSIPTIVVKFTSHNIFHTIWLHRLSSIFFIHCHYQYVSSTDSDRNIVASFSDWQCHIHCVHNNAEEKSLLTRN